MFLTPESDRSVLSSVKAAENSIINHLNSTLPNLMPAFFEVFPKALFPASQWNGRYLLLGAVEQRNFALFCFIDHRKSKLLSLAPTCRFLGKGIL